MDFEFRNIGECISNEIRNFIFSNKQAFYPDEEFVIDDINCCINKGSKVYECYVDNRLIAFIILNLKIRNGSSCYEILFGKFDKNVHFVEILEKFIQDYNEELNIFAVLENSNIAFKRRVCKILEKVGFAYEMYNKKYNVSCAGNELVFIPQKNNSETLHIHSEKELEFILFCVEFVAKSLNQEPDIIYQKLKESGLLQNYIIDNYEILHTLGKDYLVNDIIQIMKERQLL